MPGIQYLVECLYVLCIRGQERGNRVIRASVDSLLPVKLPKNWYEVRSALCQLLTFVLEQ